MKNNTVGTTETTLVETEITRSKKQESHDFSRERFTEQWIDDLFIKMVE